MMDNKDKVQKEVEETMKALDGVDRASTDEYFFTRLEARMSRNEEHASRLPGLSWGIAAVLIILFVNTYTLISFTGSENFDDGISEQEITALAEEYALTVPSLYEQEIDE
ncbi:hypothetical protein G3570_14055 [Balneolaceae bacterium YR4-1]|uniref:Uncharacterized protein n=1 Tax=Halalkalibaculum roseum TaxID=2709311 RepID=A0A6M1T4Q5_9BACT|nr:hypothetical protein [Halalkalibaculum roseum]NGP77767.1 hypothetical protein [Halalkalibaculum roseum]